MNDTPPRENPYVGPRSFLPHETLYGRDNELAELTNLIIAERIVLLYSPSGAGKSSLVNAGLLKKLDEEGFLMLRVARLNHEPPERLAQPPGFNRYVYSALETFDEGLPEEHRLPPEQLAAMDMTAYLDGYRQRLAKANGNPETPDLQVIILDQFEEIITIEPTDRDGKTAFFNQIGAALRNRRRWALFSMREDYLGALDPYLRPIPTRFHTTFRLDLLGVEAARQAIQSPARSQGVDFTDEAAQRLLDDLSQVQVQRPDGSMEPQQGQYVEPVQLQVVCFRLWENLKAGVSAITVEDLEQVGSVDKSLGDYYAERVAHAAQDAGVAERKIRDWFERKLITEQGVRNQVLKGQGASENLDNNVINILEGAHLVRGEKRRGATWFELAHDRLVGPVRADNQAWNAQHLNILQRMSSRWHNDKRPAHLLLHGEALEKAETWAKENPQEVTPEEAEFLQVCQQVRQDEQQKRENQEQMIKLQEEARFAGKLRQRFILAMVAAVVAGFFAVVSFISGTTAIRTASQNVTLAAEAQAASTLAWNNAGTAQANEAIAQQNQAIAISAQRTAAYNAAVAGTAAVNAQMLADFAMRQEAIAADNAEKAEEFAAQAQANADLAASRLLAAKALGFMDTNPVLSSLLGIEAYNATPGWESKHALLLRLESAQAQAIKEYGRAIPSHRADIRAVEISPDGNLLAWVSMDGTLGVWNIAEQKEEVRKEGLHANYANDVVFSHNGEMLATASDDSSIMILNTSDWTTKVQLWNINTIASISFSPDDTRIAAGVGTQVSIWDIAREEQILVMRSHNAPIVPLVWSHNGKMIATGSVDRRVIIWDAATGAEIMKRRSHDDTVFGLAFSMDDARLFSTGKEGKLIVWDVAAGKESGEPIMPHGGRSIYDVAVSPDGKYIATGGGDFDAVILDALTLEEVGRLDNYHLFGVTSVGFGRREGTLLLATGSYDNSVGLHAISTQQSLNSVVDDKLRPALAATVIASDTLKLAAVGNGRVDVLNVTGGLDKAPMFETGTFTSAALTQSGKWLALGGVDGVVTVVGETKAEKRVIALEPFEVRALAFQQDGPLLIAVQCLEKSPEELIARETTCLHQEAILLNAETGEVVRNYDMDEASNAIVQIANSGGHRGAVKALALYPDGSMFASGGEDGLIYFWDVEVGNVIGLPFTYRGGEVTALAFSPDGDTLAAAYANLDLVLWDISTGQIIGGPLVGAGGRMTALSFDPAGTRLYSVGLDGAALAWNVDPEAWIVLNCNLAQRNFTQAEWKEFLPEEDFRRTCEQYPIGEE